MPIDPIDDSLLSVDELVHLLLHARDPGEGRREALQGLEDIRREFRRRHRMCNMPSRVPQYIVLCSKKAPILAQPAIVQGRTRGAACQDTGLYR